MFNAIYRVLKAITQTIIAAPFVELKQQFAEIGCEFVDVSGTWGIKVSIGPGNFKRNANY